MGFGTCFVIVFVTILYLFAWIEDLSKKTKWKEWPPKLPNPNNRISEIQRVANDAVFTARNKFGVTLDFS
jgi:nitric oxide reductase large subunit